MFQLTWKEVRLLAAIVLVLAGGGLVKALRPAVIPGAPAGAAPGPQAAPPR